MLVRVAIGPCLATETVSALGILNGSKAKNTEGVVLSPMPLVECQGCYGKTAKIGAELKSDGTLQPIVEGSCPRLCLSKES